MYKATIYRKSDDNIYSKEFESAEEMLRYMREVYDEWKVDFEDDGSISLTIYDDYDSCYMED